MNFWNWIRPAVIWLCALLEFKREMLCFISHNVPSNRSSNSASASSNFFCWLGLRCVQLVLTTAWGSAFSYVSSKICTTWSVVSTVLVGLLDMLLFTAYAFANFDLARLFMFVIGKMISSIVICFVQKSRTIPISCMVLQPRMRSYTDLVICFFCTVLYQIWFLTIWIVKEP